MSSPTLREDWRDLRADIEALSGTLRRIGAKASGELDAVASESAEDARHAYDAVVTQGRRSVEQARGVIGDRPLLSVGLALGIGFLLARLMLRR